MKSDVWCQMVADATDLPVERLTVTDVCALGAAAIAMKGAGLCASYAEASGRMARLEKTFAADPLELARLLETYGRYQKMERCMLGYYTE